MFQLNFSSLHDDSIIIHYTYPAVYDELTDHVIQKLFYPNLNPRCQVDIFRCQVKATRRQKLKNPGLSNCEFLLFLNFITAAHWRTSWLHEDLSWHRRLRAWLHIIQTFWQTYNIHTKLFLWWKTNR